MGNTSSIFYPDNENRLKRAQQLADDCKYCQDQYNASKARVEQTLGPLKEKLDKLLQAFGCANIGELDNLVLQSATGEALEHWKETRKNYDQSLVVDQVIMGAEAVVTMVGIVASAIGALAGGIGFFVGLGITADVLLVLGAIGALYDIINGAIQRGKLRDAINEFVPTRLKAKYAQEQMDQLEKSLPAIQTIYQTYEDLGYNKDKILEKFKDHEWLKTLKTESAAITYRGVGQELADEDSHRGSWTNEDPDWHPIADQLDAAKDPAAAAATAAAVAAAAAAVSNAMNGFRMFNVAEADSVDTVALPPVRRLADTVEAPLTPDADVTIKLLGDDIASILSGVLHVKLRDFESKDSAKVSLDSQDDKQTLTPDLANHTVNWAPSDASLSEWILRFVNPADAESFATTANKARPDKVEVYMHTGDAYVTKRGTLSNDLNDPSVVLVAAYA